MGGNPPRAAGKRSAEPGEDLDVLIELDRNLFESDDLRQGAADGRIAVALTAALTLAAISITAWDDVANATQAGKLGVAAVALIAAIVALLRAGAGYFHRAHPLFSTHYKNTSDALEALRQKEAQSVPEIAGPDSQHWRRSDTERWEWWRLQEKPTRQETPYRAALKGLDERELARAVWRNRAIDARTRAKRKERAAALAAALLAAVLAVFGAAAFIDALWK